MSQRLSHEVGIATVNDQSVRQHFHNFTANAAAVLDANCSGFFGLVRECRAFADLALGCFGSNVCCLRSVCEDDLVRLGRREESQSEEKKWQDCSHCVSLTSGHSFIKNF